MSTFFLDSSALVKRYLTETGSGWVLRLTDPAAGHTISIAELTEVEVAAALAARHRAPGGITRAERDAVIGLLAPVNTRSSPPAAPFSIGRST